jgi:hypothetical protein
MSMFAEKDPEKSVEKPWPCDQSVVVDSLYEIEAP